MKGLAAALTAGLLAAGCVSGPASEPRAGTGTATATPSVAPPPRAAARPFPISLPALMGKSFDGRDLRLGRVLARASEYTRSFVTYRSGSLRISGIINIPRGRGPFPVIVLNHGYIDPAIYTNGRGLRREQDHLARNGFAVLHIDYRNHAQSDDDPQNDLRMRLGYTEDAINAVMAIRRSSLPSLDRERVGMLGRSMGGGVTLNAIVASPRIVDAAVLYAPVSSNAVDNFNRWIRRRAVGPRILERYGTPAENPGFWRNLSAVRFFDRVQVPVQIHHGTADDTCPIVWSRRTARALRAKGKDVTLLEYPGEGHAFGPEWARSMARTVSFFRQNLTT